MDFSEKWGKDVDEAVRLALIDLKLTEDQVNVIVLEEPTKGFFGLGSKLAKVRVEKKPELIEKELKEKEREREIKEGKGKKPEPSFKKDKPHAPKREPEYKPERRESKEEKLKQDDEVPIESSFTIREKPADLVEMKDSVAGSFLKEITEKMGLNLNIKVMGNDSCIYVDMQGRDSGTIIGKRGQTLDSIQYLTSLVVNKGKDKYLRVVVDAENYREKREKTLEQLANRLADKVIKTRKSVRLEPMNPYERKVIHATLQSNRRVTTRSEGEEPYRRVIIELK
ncbi:RNA-binding cell elongation regulator Jag/EloR [Sinanaerobacter chloroacetimidivorans]|uniref:RNA-binding protein KhpB n=1 Tax=Sinanaerobacter chloroacetimidivorans TaxID=2818044 RepID=A0A8J7W3I5_9FIRM|nr:RNA-binding cell elongation regulator Jag/EloR [Sinanaerobacter chloroacetimidivorans]MBR0598426.1 protein jag [Sinanaerobacter chloroacetimidivorans]